MVQLAPSLHLCPGLEQAGFVHICVRKAVIGRYLMVLNPGCPQTSAMPVLQGPIKFFQRLL